jgi:hypothetical protein
MKNRIFEKSKVPKTWKYFKVDHVKFCQWFTKEEYLNKFNKLQSIRELFLDSKDDRSSA